MRQSSRFFLLSLLSAALFSIPLASSGQELPKTTRLLRFPTTNGDQIVFCYAGELYTVGKDGGTARRLTSGPGYSSFPRFSADGKQLAFTSQYDGNTEVYVMPGEGGSPKRLTTTATLGRDDVSDRMGPNNLVMTWENTKPLVVFRSRKNLTTPLTASSIPLGSMRNYPSNFHFPVAASHPSLRTTRRWLSTGSSGNSALGNTIEAGWRTMSGSTISRPNKQPT